MNILLFIIGLIFAQFGFVIIIMHQAQNIGTNLIDIAKYTLMVSPILIILNILVNVVTNYGNKIFNNLAFTSIANTMMGVVMALVIAAVVFKEPPSLKAIIGCIFILIGVILTGIK